MDDRASGALEQQRKQFIPGFQSLEKTKEYVERTYFELKDRGQQRSHIELNAFWVELAQHIANTSSVAGFLTEKFIFALKNTSELVAVLAFMDLPFQGDEYKMNSVENRRTEITAGPTSLLIFQKEICEGKADIRGDIAIIQRFFDPKDRYTFDEDDPTIKVEKSIDE